MAGIKSPCFSAAQTGQQLYELQNYIFIREIIRRGLFNRQSLKHPDDAIPDFKELYAHELKEKCGLELQLREA